MIEYVVRQIRRHNYKHEKYFIFDLDDSKGMCYRSRVSSNYFFYGDKERNKNAHYLFIGAQNSIIEQKRTAENVALFGNISVIRLNNLWEFYKAIGYDYKRQRWF